MQSALDLVASIRKSLDEMEAILAAPPVGKSLRLAQNIAAKCVLGVNWERERVVTNYQFTPEYAAYMDEIGLTHIRLFYPWKPSGIMSNGNLVNFWDSPSRKAPSKDQFARFFASIHKMQAAGKVVFLDLLDVVGYEDFSEDLQPIVEQWVSDCGGWIAAEGFDPSLLVVGTANEWAGGINEAYYAHRVTLHKLLREKLPEPYVLSTSPAYWAHWSSFIDNRHGVYKPVDDMAVIHLWHAYDALSAQEWEGVQAGLDRWSRDNGGRVILNGELGAGSVGQDFLANGGWVEHINRQNPALARSAPCYWAITEGDWKLNRGWADPRFWRPEQGWEPDIEGAMKAAAAANRKARGL